jgi:hypothetical protein
MGKVIASASKSLDGFIAEPAKTGFERLSAWHRDRDVEVPPAPRAPAVGGS